MSKEVGFSDQSPIDKFLLGPDAKLKGLVDRKSLKVEKDENGKYLRMDFEEGSYEVFLNDDGSPAFSRSIYFMFGKIFEYPNVAIDGKTGDLEYEIYRGVYGHRVVKQEEGFSISFGLISNFDDYKIGYYVKYGMIGEIIDTRIVFFPSGESKDKPWEKPNVRFVEGVNRVYGHNPSSGKARNEDVLSSTALNTEVIYPQVNFSFRLEGEKAASSRHLYNLHAKDLGSDRKSTLVFPSELSELAINRWDEKLRAPGREWKDLNRKMPISLQVANKMKSSLKVTNVD